MSKAADFPFCCVRSVGCVLLFLRSGCLVFVLFMLFVFCVLWWRIFSGIVRIYIIIRYSPFLLGFLL